MPIPVNPNLVWDYEIPAEEEQTEAFRKWYLARVLSRGNAKDLREIGFETIYEYFPRLNLPIRIRKFWAWYFSLPEIKARYESINTFSTSNNTRN